jgi:hypothetical protein
MNSKELLSIIINWLLRIAIIFFIFPFFYDNYININLEQSFWNWIVKILLIIFFIGLSLTIIFLKKSRFYNLGFFIVFIGSFYKILDIAFQKGLSFEQINYFLLVIVSIYFMSKTDRSHRKKRY